MSNDEIQERAIANGRNVPGCPEQWTFPRLPKRLRFWHWWNDGFVKLTVTVEHDEDNPLVLRRAGSTDEGWYAETELYWLEDGCLMSETISDGRGCDGRLTTTTRHRCPPSDLKANAPHDGTPDPDVRLPHWTEVRSDVYDEYAQAAGY